MKRGEEIKAELQDVDCAPYLQRLILEDPDPSSPLYIPKAPPRNYETLSKAIEAGKYSEPKFDQSLPQTSEEIRGVNFTDKRSTNFERKKPPPKAHRKPERTSNVQRQMADFHKGMDFTDDDPFSLYQNPLPPSPFGGGESSPFGGRDNEEEDTFSGFGEPLYPDIPALKDKADAQFARAQRHNKRLQQEADAEDYRDDDRYGEREYAEEKGGGEEYGEEEEEGEGETEEEGESEGVNEDDLDPSSFTHSTPMYEHGDEQIMQDARNLRERDEILNAKAQGEYYAQRKGAESKEQGAEGVRSSDQNAEETVPGETGSELVQEEIRPKKRLKEEFMKDREELERLMNEQDNYRREGEQPQGPLGGPPNGREVIYPRGPRGGSRIMTGQEIRQQMAMQKLAAAALKAMSKKGGQKKGKVRVMFM